MGNEGSELQVIKERATLGDGEVFLKKTAEGELRAINAIIPLDLKRKEIVNIPGGNFMITAVGYDRLNKVAGISVVYPPTMAYTFVRDGIPETREVGNPFIEYDQDSGAIKTISVTCLALGLSPVGNWAITQERLRFDLNRYLTMDSWGKVRNYKNCGVFQSNEAYQKRTDKDYFLFVKAMPGWGLALDTRHDEVQKVLTGHFTRQKFAERIASTICRRNAMKRHPAIAKSVVMPRNGVADVQVYGWKHELGTREINKMIGDVAQGQLPNGIQVITQESEVEFGSGDIPSVETDISTDTIDQKTAPSNGQASLFDSEGASTSEREANLFYIGDCDDRLGDLFLDVLTPIIPRIETIESFNDLTNEELELACKQLNKHMGGLHGQDS